MSADLNQRANATVRIALGAPRSTHGEGYVALHVEDVASGTVLLDIQIDPAQWFWLTQGGTHTSPAFISPHLDRVGKWMQNQKVILPKLLDGDTERDERRDVYKAVCEQLSEDWHNTWEDYDTPRGNNRGERYTIVRRWVTVTNA